MSLNQPRLQDDSLVTIDFNDAKQRAGAADLVLALFPASPAGALGKRFLTEFYLYDLIRDGDLTCLVHSHEGRYAALSIYTEDPFHFIGRGMRKYFFKLAYLVTLACLTKPRAALALFNVVYQGFSRTKTAPLEKVCEILTFGVLEEFRTVAVPQSGKKIPVHFFLETLRHIKAIGYQRCQGSVYKTNLKGKIFFNRYHGTAQPAGAYFDDSVLYHFDLTTL